jgi:hypothetical protein
VLYGLYRCSLGQLGGVGYDNTTTSYSDRSTTPRASAGAGTALVHESGQRVVQRTEGRGQCR